MNLKQLAYQIAKLRSAPSRPVGLWFVDRPALFYWLLRIAGDELNHLVFPYHFYGIPIHQFSPRHATEEELSNRPFFCSLPGLWIEMSDGNHMRLADE